MENFLEQEKITKNQFLKIAREIETMTAIDQDARKNALINPDQFDMNIDKNNTEHMKKIIAEIGWPTISKVGKDASSNAWLLVQHADHDIEFQKQCLSLMKEQSSSEVDPPNVAYLTDRIQVNSKLPQIYGTQFNEINGRFIPKEIEDPENVNERRKEMRLGTLEENIKMMYEKYNIEEPKQN